MAKLSDAIAPLLFAPHDWQSSAPDELFKRGVAVQGSADLRRIIALPRRPQVDPSSREAEVLVEYEMRKYGRENLACRCREIDPRRGCITRLLPIQAIALYEMAVAGGLLGAVVAGGGKTIIGILAALALDDPSTRPPGPIPPALMLIPPTLIEQIVVDYKMLAQHFRVPGILVHSAGASVPVLKELVEGAPTLHVLPYSMLSQVGSSDWIERLGPSAIIADECDALKDLTSARTMRLMRYFGGRADMTAEQRAERGHRVKFCGWTGSMTDHSILEFYHLAALALKYGSPLPLSVDVAEDWARCLDAVESPCPPGALLDMCEPGESVHEAFRRRMAETMGFVVLADSTVLVTGGEPPPGAPARAPDEVQLTVRERVAPPLPPIIELALKMVRDGERPDTLGGSSHDETLTDALQQAKVASEVSCGFFYRWIFPRGEKESLIEEWYAARKLWNKELRAKVMRGEEHLDSPKLCENACRRAYGEIPVDDERPMPEWRAHNWARWRDVRDLVEPKTSTVRLHDFLVRDAATWALENRGILWYGAVEFAQWVQEVTAEHGPALTIHAGGPGAGERLRRERGERSIIASIKSHGRGRDGLQHIYDHALVANPPASSAQWEQLLARLHRRGQRSPRVLAEVYAHTDEVLGSLEQALRRSEYVRSVLGGEQRLLGAWEG